MKVTVTHRERIELDADAVKECFEQHLNDLCGGEDVHIDTHGVVWEEDEYRHGTPTASKVANPTEVQLAALRLKAALKNWRKP